ncbi:MAG TPA: tRNA guanosine(34) transglycosylase Tgt [Patescibacteria group bacterium]|nr:tRNA guanosine(34) transglycosylase Tgt [Patescibacteria group bacterium]
MPSKKSGKNKGKNRDLDIPVFMPDATRGFVKLLDNRELKSAGVEAVVVNTFHLYLNPGLETIKKTDTRKVNYKKGIHRFMGWDGLVLSDSGGFQVFSLIHKNPKMGKIDEDKVTFRSPYDGSLQELSPEKSIQIQFDLGSDMMVCLDDCPPYGFSRKKIEKAVERTIAWARRCRREYDKQVKKRKIPPRNRPLLFSVIQGGADPELRRYCARELTRIGFDGYGFGARPVDEQGNFLQEVLQATSEAIPEGSIKFALGIGMPEDIVRCSRMGWDLFDCVIPTREGRHGRLFQFQNQKSLVGSRFYNVVNIENSRFKNDLSPINPDSSLSELRKNSKAYLHHLFKVKETLGKKWASLNNLEFYTDLMNDLRKEKKKID